MEKPNRKITWVHCTYLPAGFTEIAWVADIWKDGKYLRHRKRTFVLKPEGITRIERLLRCAKLSGNTRYILPAYNGWSICFEALR